MIDLHCHLLPGIDDGARDLAMALAMARLAVDDGITVTACTPHIYPGLFENTAAGIRDSVDGLREALASEGIPLELTLGADIQIVPELVQGLGSGALPTLHGSRYFLFEPPHHIPPPGLLDLVHSTLAAGYVPVITHPERLAYAEARYADFEEAVQLGAWLQLTGGALVGRFGPRVQALAQRFLRDGLVHLLASDGHNLKNRTPVLAEAREAAALIVGDAEAERLVRERPQAVLDDAAPSAVPPPAVAPPRPVARARRGFLSRLIPRL